MDPEVGISGLSPKIDIWALGCTFWAVLELRSPFEAGDDGNEPSIFWIANFIKTEQRLPFVSQAPPPRVRLLIEACWCTEAAKRPTAGACVKELEMETLCEGDGALSKPFIPREGACLPVPLE